MVGGDILGKTLVMRQNLIDQAVLMPVQRQNTPNSFAVRGELEPEAEQGLATLNPEYEDGPADTVPSLQEGTAISQGQVLGRPRSYLRMSRVRDLLGVGLMRICLTLACWLAPNSTMVKVLALVLLNLALQS